MTIDQFRSEYHLLDKVSDGPVETHHAQAATGAMVMVHFLRGTEAHRQSMLQQIERLQPDLRRRVLRTIDVDSTAVVVTRFILDMQSFEDWLHQGARAEPEPPVSREQPVDSPSGFTGMFQAVASPTAALHSEPADLPAPAAPQPVAEVPVAEQPVAEQPVAEEPVAEQPVAEQPVAEQPVAEEPVAEQPVAEQPVAEEPVAERPVVRTPGEMTLMFQRMASGETAQEPEIKWPEPDSAPEELPPTAEPPLVPEAADVTPKLQEPGEFTRLFAVPDFGRAAASGSGFDAPPADAAFPEPAHQPAQAEPAPPAQAEAAPPAQAQPTPPTPAEPPGHVAESTPPAADAEWKEAPIREAPDAGPGEFTRMFRTPAPPAAVDASGSSPASPVPSAPAAWDATAVPQPKEPEAGEAPAGPAAEIQSSPTPPWPPTDLPHSLAGAQAPPPVATRPPSPTAAPGEFTQMFGSAVRPDETAGPVPPKLPTPPPTEKPGAGWTFDERPSAPPAPSDAWNEPSWKDNLPPAGGTGAPGSYTQVFGAPMMPPVPPPAQSPPAQPPHGSGAGLFGGTAAGGAGGAAGSDDYFARLAATSTPGRMPPPASSLPQPHAGGPVPGAGPSEFTRVISAMPSMPSHLTPPPSATSLPPAAPPAKAGGDRWLILGMVGVLVVAVLFVLLFVLLGG